MEHDEIKTLFIPNCFNYFSAEIIQSLRDLKPLVNKIYSNKLNLSLESYYSLLNSIIKPKLCIHKLEINSDINDYSIKRYLFNLLLLRNTEMKIIRLWTMCNNTFTIFLSNISNRIKIRNLYKLQFSYDISLNLVNVDLSTTNHSLNNTHMIQYIINIINTQDLTINYNNIFYIPNFNSIIESFNKRTKSQPPSTKSTNKVINYSFIDLNKISQSIPFSDTEFSLVEKNTPQSLIDKDKINKTSFYKTYLELLKRTNEKYNNSKSFIDKYFLVRYAVGFSGNTERAWTFLVSYVDYKEFYIDKLLEDEKNTNTLKNNKYFSLFNHIGSDIYGRPIIFTQAKLFQPKEISKELLIDILIVKLETEILKLPKNIDKLILMIDLSNTNSSNSSLNHFKLAQEIMNKCYVERMANIIIINKGFFFKFLWKILSSFLPERVIKKILVLDDSNKASIRKMIGEDIYSKLIINK